MKLSRGTDVFLCLPLGTLIPRAMERRSFRRRKRFSKRKEASEPACCRPFAYRRTIQYVNPAAFRAGVEIIEVNHAHTSTSERGDSNCPTCANCHDTLQLPVRNRAKHVWSFWSDVSRQIRGTLAAYGQLLPQQSGSTPRSRCCQTVGAT